MAATHQDHMDVVHEFLRVLSGFRVHNFHVIFVTSHSAARDQAS
jgi:hypothetical protein